MIFNCPSCQAGHSVPVSMIPAGGMELTCRRCGSPFPVVLPSSPGERDLVDSTSTPGPLERTDEMPQAELEREPEATTVGIDNPFDELSKTGQAPLMAPSGELVANPVASGESSDNPDVPTQALAAERLPTGTGVDLDPPTGSFSSPSPRLGHRGEGVDPELDSTQRVDVDDEAPLGAPTVAAPHPASQDGPAGHDLYERVERGQYVPEEPRSEVELAPAPKAWNEPSRSVQAQRPKGALRILADSLNAAPLPLKVGLSVFPVALGLTLILTSSPEAPPSEKVEIVVPVPDAGVDEPAPTRVTMPPPGTAAKVTVAPFADPPAPDGYAYVQVGEARLRAKAQAKSPAVAKLEAGALVRLYPGTDEWALVVVEPEGPAGFLPKPLLGVQLPLARLAADLAFPGCAVEGGASVDDCLFDAKQAQEACTERCGGPTNAPVRCVEACGAAFDACSKTCFESAKDRRGKKRH